MNINASEHEKTLSSMLTGLTTFCSNLLGAYEAELKRLSEENAELKAKVGKDEKPAKK